MHAVGSSEGLCCFGGHHNSTREAEMFSSQTWVKAIGEKKKRRSLNLSKFGRNERYEKAQLHLSLVLISVISFS